MLQLRQTVTPFHSHVVDFLERHTDILEGLVAEMDAGGLSTRDFEDALRDATGERLITRTDVSAITRSLWTEYVAFRCNRSRCLRRYGSRSVRPNAGCTKAARRPPLCTAGPINAPELDRWHCRYCDRASGVAHPGTSLSAERRPKRGAGVAERYHKETMTRLGDWSVMTVASNGKVLG
jgi:hypothetical protein